MECGREGPPGRREKGKRERSSLLVPLQGTVQSPCPPLVHLLTQFSQHTSIEPPLGTRHCARSWAGHGEQPGRPQVLCGEGPGAGGGPAEEQLGGSILEGAEGGPGGDRRCTGGGAAGCRGKSNVSLLKVPSG